MEIAKLSTKYHVCKLSEQNIDDILELCRENPLFYQYCPPTVTKEGILEDMAALPPGTTYEDKYYLGFYDGRDLIALMDLILNYPNKDTAFIGFFMVTAKRQNNGLGTFLIKDILDCLFANGYTYTRLGYVKGNPQSKAFWYKNGFAETGVEVNTKDYTIIALQRSNKCYYKAYDDRYKAIHAKNHTWSTDTPTPILMEMLQKNKVPKDALILEIGCGEGRDSIAVLKEGYRLLAIDVSLEAVRFCKEHYPDFSHCFQVIDACKDTLDIRFSFIYATAVLHMLVDDADRKAFFKFIYDHLNEDGKAMILTMGDGVTEFSTDINTAYDIQERTNNASNIPVNVPNTSCRMVNFETLKRELTNGGFIILETGIANALPDFNSLMYALVSKN